MNLDISPTVEAACELGDGILVGEYATGRCFHWFLVPPLLQSPLVWQG